MSRDAEPGTLLVTRPRHQAASFARLLRRRGCTCTVAPCLRIVGIADWSVPDREAQAIVVTSANAVPALSQAVAPMRREPRIVAVGPDTASAIRRAGFRRILVAAGTAESVTALVGRRLRPEDGPLLHLAGRDVAGDLIGGLAARGFRLDRVSVYGAEACETLPSRAARLLREGRVGGVLLFSPRSARIFVDLATRAGLHARLHDAAALVISGNTAAAAGDVWGRIEVAAAPSRAAMAALATAFATRLSR